MAAARFVDMDSVVADPAAGRFRGSKRELLVGRILTPPSRWESRNSKPSAAEFAAELECRRAKASGALWHHGNRVARPTLIVSILKYCHNSTCQLCIPADDSPFIRLRSHKRRVL